MMEESKSDKQFLWICVTSYFTVWLLVVSKGLAWPHLIPALILAGTYAGMHYYEMVSRGHCALSADSTAIPVTFPVAALGALLAYFEGIPVYPFLMSIPVAWMAGHAALFALIFILSKFGIGGGA